jgi:AcrR family transcriptional regulator
VPTGTWERLPEARRAAVMDAAEAEFAERGFSQVSLNVIAREAGVAKGSLFQYFTDKLDLYAFIADQAGLRIRTAMMARLAELEPETRPLLDVLEDLLRSWIGYFAAHPVERALTAAVNLEGDPAVRIAVRNVANRHYLDVLRPLMETGQQRGHLRGDADIDMFLSLLLLVLPHVALAPHVEGIDPLLGMYGADDEHTALIVKRFMAVVATAFGPTR